MSVMYRDIRQKAAEIALEEKDLTVTETNHYPAVEMLDNPNHVILQNRGPVVDKYLLSAGVTIPAMNAYNKDEKINQQYNDARDWCGMFVYYCYKKAIAGTGLQLPFEAVNLWSPVRMRTWAVSYMGRTPVEKNDDSSSGNINSQRKAVKTQEGQHLLSRNMEDIHLIPEKLIVWDKKAFQPFNADHVYVKAGDIFSNASEGHMGIACSDSSNGVFDTVEGNQQMDIDQYWNGILRKTMRITDCSLIIRI